MIALLMLATVISTPYVTGKELYSDCKESVGSRSGCTTYASAVIDGHRPAACRRGRPNRSAFRPAPSAPRSRTSSPPISSKHPESRELSGAGKRGRGGAGPTPDPCAPNNVAVMAEGRIVRIGGASAGIGDGIDGDAAAHPQRRDRLCHARLSVGIFRCRSPAARGGRMRQAGYVMYFPEELFASVLPDMLANKVRMVTNAGAVNPRACAAAMQAAASAEARPQRRRLRWSTAMICSAASISSVPRGC